MAAFLAIPFLIRLGGADGWAAIAVGQSVGGVVATVSLFGWGVSGPTEISRTTIADRGHVYWVSFWMRLGVLALSLPAGMLFVDLFVDPQFKFAALGVLGATSLQSLTANWYLSGLRMPYRIAVLESVPRALAQVIGVLSVYLSDHLWLYGIVLLVSELIFVILSTVLFASPMGFRSTLIAARVRIRQQAPLVLSAVAGASYTKAAVPIVAAVAPGAVAVFSVLDRVQQVARAIISPLTMYFQGWVVSDASLERSRKWTATIATMSIGTASAAFIWAFLPPLSPVVFSDEIEIDYVQSGLLALVVWFVSASLCTGLYYLVPAGEHRTFALSSIFSALVGVFLLLSLPKMAGATGALGALVAVESLVVLIQSTIVGRARSLRRS